MDTGELIALWVARSVLTLCMLVGLAGMTTAPAAIYLGVLFVWSFPSGRRLLRSDGAQSALWALLAATISVVAAWAVVVAQVPQGNRTNQHWSWIPLAGAAAATWAVSRHRRNGLNGRCDRCGRRARTSVRP